ncbi:extracellular solute-binding protein [Dokdonella koreensis]|uniref:Ferric iron ABC transporter, iron-binding protein n=1 Tax=Dokdonella koreensis DS-123 TaxID=1300342 RepID=A0A161HJ58_9GAMM|nr:extracellular solute-binding protein [Dokdonella koreensis]ANB16570.1 Ferric iron ABC transporter, iron-binding protein [Dokdonella koreensis DS-123]
MTIPAPLRRRASRFAVALAALLAVPALAAGEVNLYTTREPGLIQPLLDAFTADSGIKVNTVFVKDGLAERVAAEGRRSPADVLMTVDFGNLIDLVDKDLVQPVRSEALAAAIPAQLRDPEGRWFALSVRARVLYASKDRTSLSRFTYEELADPAWKGKICIRSGLHPYNTALIAAYIAHHGEAAAETWLKGVKANLARKPGGGDREVARDILGQLCDIGVANSYYVGRMRSGKGGPEQQKWGDAINVVLPTFKDGGTQVNVSGASVARHAPNREAAVKLLDYLVSEAAQTIYATIDFEYPVRPGIAADPIIAGFGTLAPDPLPLTEIARHRKAASLLAEKIGFDN